MVGVGRRVCGLGSGCRAAYTYAAPVPTATTNHMRDSLVGGRVDRVGLARPRFSTWRWAGRRDGVRALPGMDSRGRGNRSCRLRPARQVMKMALFSLPRVDGNGRGWVPACAGTTVGASIYFRTNDGGRGFGVIRVMGEIGMIGTWMGRMDADEGRAGDWIPAPYGGTGQAFAGMTEGGGLWVGLRACDLFDGGAGLWLQ